MRDASQVIAAGLAMLCAGLMTRAAPGDNFTLLDDFETRLAGDINGQGGWTASGGAYTVVDDPETAGNAVLRAAVSSDEARHPLLIPNGEIRTGFLRLRIGAQQNISLGFSDLAGPTEINDFEVELNMANSGPDLRANDDGAYDVIATLAPERWYNLWILVDNLDDRFDVYLHDRGLASAAASDRIAEGLVFRNGGAGDLRSLFIKTGGGSSSNQGPLYLDDIYVGAGGLNLGNPASSPADWNGDGAVDVLDLLAYLDDWFAQAPIGDLTGDGNIDVFDLLGFLDRWFAA